MTIKNSLGLGRRIGKPKTDAQRRRDHQKRFPGTPLPKRGTGLKRKR